MLDEVRANGPLTAREVEHDVPREKDNWGWNWSEVKTALEYLFYKGEVTAARRNSPSNGSMTCPNASSRRRSSMRRR